MWRGILFVGVITAVSTLAVFDASLPGGFIEGSGNLPYAQTMTFTTLVLAQLFNVFNARSDERSAFVDVFRNRWVWLSIALSLAFQLAVVHAPAMQRGFGTVDLGVTDWLECGVAASVVLWVREANKLVTRAFADRKRR
jgi:Ca2+-transporting ATPase